MRGFYEAKAHAIIGLSPVEDTSLGKQELSYASVESTLHGQHRRGSASVRLTTSALSLLVVVCMVLLVSAPCIYATTLYWSEVRAVFAKWWGIHGEMVDASYLVATCVVPLAVSCIAIELLRRLNRNRPRRRKRFWLMNVSSALRRHPRISLLSWTCRFSYGELLFLLVLLGGNTLVFWHNFSRRYQEHVTMAPHSAQYPGVRLFGRSMGFNSIFNMVFLFLPATRNCAWMEFLNLSYANAIRFHRWLGVVTVLTAVIHCGCYYWCWVSIGEWQKRAIPCWSCSWKDKASQHIWVNVFGEIALACFLLISVTSIPAMRRRMFNIFYSVHQLLFVAVAFTILHWGAAAWFLLPTVAAYTIGRAISQCNVFGPAPVQVLEVVMLGDAMCKLVLARDVDFEPGQFVYLNAPAISRLEWHPFTIANSNRLIGAPSVALIVKALGDWTQAFVEHTQSCVEQNIAPTVYVDGLYGASIRDAALPYDKIVLIGGGIGVTPLLSLMEDIAGTSEDIEGRTNPREVHLIFSFREVELLLEIAPLLRRLRWVTVGFKTSLFLTSHSRERIAAVDHLGQPRTQMKRVMRVCPPAYPFAQPFSPSFGQAEKTVIDVLALVIPTLALGVLEYRWGSSSLSWLIPEGGLPWMIKRMAQLSALFFGTPIVYAFGSCRRLKRTGVPGCRPQSTSGRNPYGDIGKQSSSFYQRLLSSDHDHEPNTDNISENDIAQLLQEFGVRVDEHPDFDVLLRDHAFSSCPTEFVDYRKYQRVSSTDMGGASTLPVGVFVSGPSTLELAARHSMSAIGSQKFDIHTEEFEL